MDASSTTAAVRTPSERGVQVLSACAIVAALALLFPSVALAQAGLALLGAAGAPVSVVVSEAIATAGADSNGLDLRGGGAVSASINADITASGAGSNGALLQGPGPISAVVAPGVTVSGGSGFAAGVRFVGGGGATLVNQGAITSAAGVDGTAIIGGTGADTVENFGVLSGAIDLGPGADLLHNHAPGVIQSGVWITLGPGETFLNEGALSPGGSGRVMTTGLSGSYVQAASGVMAVDLDLSRTGQAGEADRLAATGSASVGGVVRIQVLNPGLAQTGDHTVTIISAAGGASQNGLSLIAPTSAVATFSLRQPNPGAIQLGYVIDFFPAGMNHNQSMVGDAFNKIQQGPPIAGFAPVVAALVDAPTVTDLARLYDQLSAEPYTQQAGAAQEASLAFTDRLFTCAPAVGQSAIDRQSACGWVNLDGRKLTRSHTAESQHFEEAAVGVSLGGEMAIAPRWRLGAALGFESADANLDHASSHGGRLQGGVVLKREQDWAELALAVTGGGGRFRVVRSVDVISPGAQALGHQSIAFTTLSARIGRVFGSARGWIRPSMEVAWSFVHSGAFTETGAGPLNLQLAGHDQGYWRLRPAIEAGSEIDLGGGVWLRPTAKLALNRLASSRISALDSTFEGAPAGLAPMIIQTRADRTTGETWLGLTLIGRRGVAARLGYMRQFGATTIQQGGQLKVVVPL